MLPEVKRVDLSNGFTALLVERRTLPIVCSMVWYSVGSRDEKSGETGLSHFLEHMMFKGTDAYGKGAIDQLTGKMGGSNNAFTDNDVTAYYFLARLRSMGDGFGDRGESHGELPPR